MKLKVNFGLSVFSTKDIAIPTRIIKAGEVFFLKDAYKEGNGIIIGIDTLQGVQEAGFLIPKGKRIKNREDIRKFVNSFMHQYVEGANHYVISKTSENEK